MYKCDHPGCKYTHEKMQGVTAHKSAAHLTPEQNAARVAKRLATMQARRSENLEAIKPIKVSKALKFSADDVFTRVEKATRILFPDPDIFYERFEEIAELRAAMLRIAK
jgi:hypothetical protein